MQLSDKQKPVSKVNATARRASTRVVKAKRNADFIYNTDDSSLPNANVNAQLVKTKASKVGKVGHGHDEIFRKKVKSTNLDSKEAKGKAGLGKNNNGKFESKVNNIISDSIQVSVNSDEEELDYNDDLIQDEEEGSIDGSNLDSETKNEGDSDIVQEDEMDLDLGATSSSLTDEQLVMNNPHLKKLFNRMLDERIQKAKKTGESSGLQLLTRMTDLPKTKTPLVAGWRATQCGIGTVTVLKAPSDTTIYIPTLKQMNVTMLAKSPNIVNNVIPSRGVNGTNGKNECGNSLIIPENGINVSTRNTDAILRISNFVDQLRLEHDENNEVTLKRPKSTVNAPGLEEAQKRMEQVIVETVKFKAIAEKPPGKSTEFLNFPMQGKEGESGNHIGNLSGHSHMLQSLQSQPVTWVDIDQQTEFQNAQQVMSTTPIDTRWVIGLGGHSNDGFFHQTCHIDVCL